jgi:hypothetical protein
MHVIPNTPTHRKKQRPLKEVLTRRDRCKRRPRHDNCRARATRDAEDARQIEIVECQD